MQRQRVGNDHHKTNDRVHGMRMEVVAPCLVQGLHQDHDQIDRNLFI